MSSSIKIIGDKKLAENLQSSIMLQLKNCCRKKYAGNKLFWKRQKGTLAWANPKMRLAGGRVSLRAFARRNFFCKGSIKLNDLPFSESDTTQRSWFRWSGGHTAFVLARRPAPTRPRRDSLAGSWSARKDSVRHKKRTAPCRRPDPATVLPSLLCKGECQLERRFCL